MVGFVIDPNVSLMVEPVVGTATLKPSLMEMVFLEESTTHVIG